VLEGGDLGVSLARTGMSPLPYHLTGDVDHDRTNPRVGVGVVGRSQLESSLHVAGIAHLAP
jgi:hypothetical protein